ncbi:MAG: cell surface protein SprA [Chloroherpetonaceae bacterium]|nr:cell surface protein SprA [Chloroherpetonaceae bacterium]
MNESKQISFQPERSFPKTNPTASIHRSNTGNISKNGIEIKSSLPSSDSKEKAPFHSPFKSNEDSLRSQFIQTDDSLKHPRWRHERFQNFYQVSPIIFASNLEQALEQTKKESSKPSQEKSPTGKLPLSATFIKSFKRFFQSSGKTIRSAQESSLFKRNWEMYDSQLFASVENSVSNVSQILYANRNIKARSNISEAFFEEGTELTNEEEISDSAKANQIAQPTQKPDTTKRTFSTKLDSLTAFPTDSTARLEQFRYRKKDSPLFPISDPKNYPLYVPRVGITRNAILDSTGRFVIITETAGNFNLRPPLILPFEEYDSLRLKIAIQNNFREIIKSRSGGQARDALSEVFNKITRISIYVPGGESSIFSTLFGPPTVSVQVAGNVDIRAGLQMEDSEDPIRIAAGTANRSDPSFDQQVQLNLAGAIGDKLLISADWNTQRPFQFENQIKIRYKGYEDDIVQSIEAGNVSLSIPTSLIGSNQALFGIKTQLQFAGLSLQTVLSQQRGRSDRIPIVGGGQTLNLNILAADYDYLKHFFLTRFHSTSWDTAFAIVINANRSDGPALITGEGGRQLTRVEVWRSSAQGMEAEANRRSAVALFNYGDENYSFEKTFGGGRYNFPTAEYRGKLPDGFSNAEQYLEALRLQTESTPPVIAGEGFAGEFKLLVEGQDYDIDRTLGYISVRQSLADGDVIAVALEFASSTPGVDPIRIGNFSNDASIPARGRLLLKMIKPAQLFNRDTASWAMMLKNIYSLGSRDIQREGFELKINYIDQGSNPPERETLPLEGNNTNLLTLTRLDNFNQGLIQPPDQIFDFVPLTLDTRRGLLIFPYVRPFDVPIKQELNRLGITDSTVRNRLIFSEIYTADQAAARQQNGSKQYYIRGRVKGSAQSVFSLGFNVVEGSVRVVSNGNVLTEGTDYRVDYQLGQVEITRPDLLSSGANLEVSFEKNDLALLAARNILGARAEYVFSDRFKLGGTFLQYSERPLADKVRIGDEPIVNSIYGFDTQFSFRSMFLTRLIDALPFISTKEESEFSFSAEFAQILPSSPAELFTSLDPEGVSYIDDFDATKQIITLGLEGNQWSLSSPPTESSTPTVFEDSLLSNRRSQLSWYRLPPGSGDRRNVRTNVIFPNRFAAREDQIVRPLNLDFYPTRRGPYNFSPEFFIDRNSVPDSMWGGIMRFFPPFMQNLQNPPKNNIEFMEFWIKLDSLGGPIPDNGKMYIELGSINEDIIPNAQFNIEDGMPISDVPGQDDDPASIGNDGYGRFLRASGAALTARINGVINFVGDRTEDVGLDGISSEEERVLHADYLSRVASILGVQNNEYLSLTNDPAGDDFSGTGSALDRVSGTEGNASIDAGAFGNRFPDRESLDNNPNLDRSNSYFQYVVPLRQSDLSQDIPIGPFVVGGGRTNGGWVQMRIPLRSFSNRVGTINGFQNIRYGRIWLKGFKNPVRVQLATLDFVGSQWQSILGTNITQPDSLVSISAINLEENAAFYASPSGISRARNRQRVDQDIRANEQSLVLTAFKVPADSFRASFRDFQPASIGGNQASGGLNLNPYKSIRAFVHGGKGIRYNSSNPTDTTNTQVFLRFGNDLQNNFYEIRYPVIPTPNVNVPILRTGQTTSPEYERAQDSLWLRENDIDINIQEVASYVLFQDPSGREQRHQLANNRTLVIRGKPSMGNVRFFMFGIRNSSPFALDTAEVWLNELRVSGFNQENGWAVKATANLKLADLMTVSASVSRQTADFHGLDVRLNQLNAQNNTLSYNVSTSFRLDKFLPAEDGWNIPLTYEFSRSTIDPKFSPAQTDIQLEVYIERLVADSIRKGATTDQAASYEQYLRFISQTNSESRRLSLNGIAKTRPSEFWLMRYTVDRLRFSFNSSSRNSRSPIEVFRDDSDWNSQIDYNLQFPQDWFIEPFKFFGSIPILSTYKDLKFYFFPQIFAISAGFNKRTSRFQLFGNLPSSPAPSMTGTRSIRLDYKITETLSLSFSSQLSGSFNKYLLEDTVGVSPSNIRERSGSDIFNLILQDLGRFNLGRDQTFNQDVSMNWRPKMIDPLNWIALDFNYGGRYLWTNPVPDALNQNGNNISSTLTFRAQSTLRFKELFGKLGLNAPGAPASSVDSSSQIQKLLSGISSVFLAVAKIDQVTLSYNYTNANATGGIRGGTGAFNFFPFSLLRDPNSPAPPSLGYQLGLSPFDGERITLVTGNIIFPQNLNQSNAIQIGTSWTPLENLRVDLNWESNWTYSRSSNIDLQTGQILNPSINGTQRRSFLSIGRNIENFTSLLLQPNGRYLDDNASLAAAFTKGFEQSAGGFIGTLFGLDESEQQFLPLPNWRISFVGLERIEFLNPIFSSISLDHAYNASSSSSFIQQLANPRIISNITISENFSPLIGVNLNWQFGLTTAISYSLNRSFTLTPETRTFEEATRGQVTLSLGYRKQGLKIPFNFWPFSGATLNNDLDVSFNFSIADDERVNYTVSTESISQIPPQGTRQLTFSPRINYALSQRVTAGFFWEFTRLEPKATGSNIFPSTRSNIGFNFRISIGNDASPMGGF